MIDQKFEYMFNNYQYNSKQIFYKLFEYNNCNLFFDQSLAVCSTYYIYI